MDGERRGKPRRIPCEMYVQNDESENGERKRAVTEREREEGEKETERFERSDLPQIAPFAGVAL